MFPGYRVQHHLSLGPTKGGMHFHQDVALGEVAALAMWMSWKCALTGLPPRTLRCFAMWASSARIECAATCGGRKRQRGLFP